MKKLIGILIAALMIVQSVGVFAEAVYVDSDLELRASGGEYSSSPVITKASDAVDYKATLDMQNVRDEFKSYYERASVALGDTVVADADVTGKFEIVVSFGEGLTIPESFKEEGKLAGFSEEVANIFEEESRTVENNTVTIVVTTTVKAGALYENLETYLPDFSLSCEGVTTAGVGSYGVSGSLVGQTSTTVGELSLVVDLKTGNADSEVIEGTVNVIEDAEAVEEVSVEISVPIANATGSTEPTIVAGEADNYEVGEITWSPALTNGKFAYSTEYTATVVATAKEGHSFVTGTTAYVNDDGVKTEIVVSEDGKTATITYTFPATKAQSSGGGGGGGTTSSFNSGSSATPTPAPTAEPSAEPTSTPDSTGWVNPFNDVSSSDWYYDAVRYVNQNNLMNGTSANAFSPDLDITRGMFITVIYRLEGEPETAAAYTFTDVDANEYYASAVAWGSTNGVILGYSDEEYAPDQVISREQMAAIMYRYAGLKGIDTTAADASYTDAGQITEYAVPGVNYCTAAGLMTGMGDGTFAPLDNTTRAEVATVIMRLDQKFGE